MTRRGPEGAFSADDTVPRIPADLIDILDDGRQEAHDRARREDPDHDQVSCACCCFDCDE